MKTITLDPKTQAYIASELGGKLSALVEKSENSLANVLSGDFDDNLYDDQTTKQEMDIAIIGTSWQYPSVT